MSQWHRLIKHEKPLLFYKSKGHPMVPTSLFPDHGYSGHMLRVFIMRRVEGAKNLPRPTDEHRSTSCQILYFPGLIFIFYGLSSSSLLLYYNLPLFSFFYFMGWEWNFFNFQNENGKSRFTPSRV